MASPDQQYLQPQSSLLLVIDNLDSLYCEELSLPGQDSELRQSNKQQTEVLRGSPANGVDYDSDDAGFVDGGEGEKELDDLLSKEEKIITQLTQGSGDCHCLPLWWTAARREAVEWMMRVKALYGFSNSTLVLSVNNFDRFSFCTEFQRERPWMIQLAAVACLSIACKVEESHVPHLMDFQVDCPYVFQAKTIERMELLVLSTLNWRMNPVTPFSYLGHLTTRLRLDAQLHQQILSECEQLVLSLITDPRFLSYPPSVIAAATMVHIMEKLVYCGSLQHQVCEMFSAKIRKDKVEDCCWFILELARRQEMKRILQHQFPQSY